MILSKNKLKIIYILAAFSLISSQYDSFDYDFLKKKKNDIENKKTTQKKDLKNSFENLVKGYVKKEGLFNYYWNEDQAKCYLAIDATQLNKTFLLNITRNTGDAYRYHGSAMMYEFPFSF